MEEVQRELGLDRVVKLASNEGPFPPFPAALEAMERAARDLNRYPDGGAFRLRAALAERRDVAFEEVAVGAGADGVIDCVSQAFLDSGDEVVCGWPSFPSYVIDALKLGATPVRVPLADARYDLDALLAAITPRTKVVYVCHPNNPTGTMNTRAELDAYFERVPEHVLTVLDQAYFEYIDDPGLRGRDQSTSGRATACSSCGRSRRSTGSPVCASGGASGAARSSRRSGRSAARSTSTRRRRSPPSRAWTTTPRSSDGDA